MQPNENLQDDELLDMVDQALAQGASADDLFHAREALRVLSARSGRRTGFQRIASLISALMGRLMVSRALEPEEMGNLAAQLNDHLREIANIVQGTSRVGAASAGALLGTRGGPELARSPNDPPWKKVAQTEKRLGEVLVEMGVLHVQELNAALVAQKFSGKLLGEVLVDQGTIEAETLERALEVQASSGQVPETNG